MTRCIAIVVLVISTVGATHATDYCWLSPTDSSETLAERIPVPHGSYRLSADEAGVGSYAMWIRGLPLRPRGTPVRLFNGKRKARTDVAHAVIDIDIGHQDLQQCADAAIRLRAEHLYSQGRVDEIWFCFTSGDTCRWTDWLRGQRPTVSGNHVSWRQTADPDSSYASLREYLDIVFVYAGSYSLSRDLESVPDIGQMRIGDLLVEGGFPGHVVIVVDMAVDTTSGDTFYLLAQGYTPAQDFHVLNNSSDAGLSPWYRQDDSPVIVTPEWRFNATDLKRFR